MQLALTGAGDLDVTNGRRRLITGRAASEQAWRVGLRLMRGEWRLNPRAGFPWREVVFVDRPSLFVIRAKLAEFALSFPGIVEVLSISLEPNPQARRLGGSVVARYEDGHEANFAIYTPGVPL